MDKARLRKSLNQYLDDHQPDYGDGDTHSILEMLYNCYRETNKFETPEIKRGYQALYDQLNHMPLKQLDEIIYIVCDLCVNYERAAYIEGIKVGIFLANELDG